MIQTAHHDWTFDTDAELWEFGGTGGWQSDDGSPSPGSLHAERGFGGSFDYGSNGGGSNLQNLWDFLGIPHTATIIRYRLSAHWKIEGISGSPVVSATPFRFRISVIQVAEGSVDLIDEIQSTVAPSAWFTSSGESDYTCGNYSPTFYAGLLAITSNSSAVSDNVNGRLDTVRVEVDYIDNFTGCCTFDVGGGPISFDIAPSTRGVLMYGSGVDWITGVTGPTSGPGTVSGTVGANDTGLGRLGIIMVNSTPFYIIQKAF